MRPLAREGPITETRKLAAILVADVVGYGQGLAGRRGTPRSRLRALRSDLIDPTIAVHHGRIVKRTGDGSIIEFRSVVDAMRCAIEVQNAMVERNAGVPAERRIEFRVGIHLGDVVEESDGDLMGNGVNVAARLEDRSRGAICLSEDAYRQVKGRLDFAVIDLGPTQLKNIADPMPRLLAASRPARAGKVREGSPARPAERALVAGGARRRDRRVAHSDRRWHVVFLRREPTRARASFRRGVALRQSSRRSGAGLPCRRANR